MGRFTGYGTTTPLGVTHVNNGVRLPFGYFLPSQGNIVAYVGKDSLDDGFLPRGIRANRSSLLEEALDKARNPGDVVVVLPNHTQDIGSADLMSALKAGTQIIGMGDDYTRPKFTWTAAGSSWLLDVPGVKLENLHLEMAAAGNGGVTVAAPMTVSAANCGVINCRVDFGADANDDVGQAFNTTAGATDFTFAYNDCRGETAAECETMLNLVGCDGVKIVGNRIYGATSAVAVGLIRAETTAHLNGTILDNVVFNRKAASEEAITLMAGCTGFMDRNYLQILDDDTIVMANDGDYMLGQDNWIANNVGERGLQLGSETQT